MHAIGGGHTSNNTNDEALKLASMPRYIDLRPTLTPAGLPGGIRSTETLADANRSSRLPHAACRHAAMRPWCQMGQDTREVD